MMPAEPQPQPQRTTRSFPDPYAADEPPRPIPGEPKRPMLPSVQYPNLYGHWNDEHANSDPSLHPATGERPRAVPTDTPLDPTLPAHSLMPEVAEEKFRVLSEVEPVRPERRSIPTEDMTAEIAACADAITAAITDLRTGKRSPNFEQRVEQLTERSRTILAAIRTEAGQPKCTLLERVLEEEGRVLQWMNAAAGVTSRRPSVEALFQTRTANDPKELQTFFRTTVETLEPIRISAERLATQPVPGAADVESIHASVRDAGGQIAHYLQSHPFTETAASSMVFGYVRSLKALSDALAVSADNQPHIDRVDQVAFQHQRALKKMLDYFASTSANVLLQLDERSGASGEKVA